MTATVMSANGTWSGAAGTADGVRDMRPDDQLAIGSITKSVIAAQVMQLVESGELALDDPATDYLPADLDFDTNQATIRQLLSMRSGIPDYVDALRASLSTDWNSTTSG
jgi:D-alanyl-D-alanine carboxypeptidase